MDYQNTYDQMNITQIPGYEGRYFITRDGRIFADGQLKGWKKFGLDWRGYPNVGLWDGKKQRCYRVHRLVAMTFIPNPQNLPEINHIDGDKTNNHVSNLEWITRSDNVKHAFATGLKIPTRGEAHVHSKLTESQVRGMRDMAKNGASTKYLSSKFKIDRAAVSNILNLKRWRHI